MSYPINNNSSSASHTYPIPSSSDDKGKEEAIPETMEPTNIIPGLPDDAAYMIFNYATNGGLDRKNFGCMQLISKTWRHALNTTTLKIFWIDLKKKTQNNPPLRSLVQQIDSNVSLAQHEIFISLFIDHVISSAALRTSSGKVGPSEKDPLSDEADPSEEISLSDIAQSQGPDYFLRFSDLTDGLRKRGAQIPIEHAVLGFDHRLYEEMQKKLDSALETIWMQIQEQIDFEGAPIPENALAIRAWLEDPANTGKIENITELNLDGLNLTLLPAEIGKFTHLTRLFLSRNKLESLPEAIGNLNQLTYLSLSGNNLGKLPKAICNLTQLTGLYLAGNNLRELPEEIGNLTQLTELFLLDNELRELPETIGNLTKLISITLTNNLLAELPETIGNLSQLTQLKLSDNKLDKLPETISRLAQLDTLYLDGNPLIVTLNKNLRESDDYSYKIFNHQEISSRYLACSSYECSSPLATLCQEIHRGADHDVLQEAFGRLSAPMQQRIHQKWSAIPSASGSSSEASDDLIADRPSFARAVITALQDKLHALSENQREQIDEQVWNLAGRPQSEDPRWGRSHAEDNIIRLIDAMELVIQE